MVEYGRIHTDGSRSGGQPVLLPCPVPWCNSLNVSSKVFEAKRKKHWLQCNDCGFSTPQMTSRAKAENIWSTRQPTHHNAVVAAAPADRIGGGGGLPCGVVGVATQSDADLLEEMRFTYETVCSEGYNDTDYTEDLDFEIEAMGWEAAFAVAVAKLRQPTQSDATLTALEQPTPEMVEDVARAFAVHSVSRCFGPDDVFIGVHGGHRYAARTALTAIAAHLRKA